MRKILTILLVLLSLPTISLAADGWDLKTGATTNLLKGVYMSNEAIAVAAGELGIDRTTNYGQTWTRVLDTSLSPKIDFSAVSFPTTTTGYAVGYTSGELLDYGVVYKTTDGGGTWTLISNLASGDNPNDVHFVSTTTGYLCSNGSLVSKTTDGGTTWSDANTNLPNATYYGIAMLDADTGFVCGAGGRIYKTINGGASWTSQNSATGSDLNDIFFIDSSNGWAVGTTGVTTRTTNGGTNWTVVASGLVGALNGVHFIDTNNGYAVGASGKIVKSTDGGVSWAEEASGTTDNLHDVYFYNSANAIAVGGNSCVIAAYTKDPTVTAVSPSSLVQGQSATLTLTTTNAQNGGAVTLSGGVTVNTTTWESPTTVKANVTVSNITAGGTKNVTLTNLNSKTGTLTNGFTVTVATPAVTSIAPAAWWQGAAGKNIVVTGTNFQNGATAAFSGAGVTVNSATFNSSTQLTLNTTIANTAAANARNLTITNVNGETGTLNSCFTPTLADPTVSAVSPSTLAQGATTTDVVLTGTYFQDGMTTAFSGTGITVNSTTFNTSTEATENITIASGATLSTRDINVTNPNSETGTLAGGFTVAAAPGTLPTVTACSRSQVAQGTSYSVTLTGTNFVTGATVSFGSGITVTSSSVTSSTSISATITVSSNASIGTRNITVVNPDTGSGSLTNGLTVAALPTITSRTLGGRTDRPAGSYTLSLTGTGFQTGATLTAADMNITFGTLTITATTITGTITIASGAADGAHTLTLTNPDNGATTTTITKNASPTISGIVLARANSGPLNWSGTITISGTGFNSPTVTTNSSSVPITVTSSNATTITGNIALGATGSYTVTVTNVDSGTTWGTITVNPLPLVASVSPSTATQGDTVDITISGSGFQSGLAASSLAWGGTGTVGITTNSFVRTGSYSLTANITVASASTVGIKNLTVTNSDTGSGSGTAVFSVSIYSPPSPGGTPTITPPTITSLSPDSAKLGTTLNVTITGTNFLNTPTVPTVVFGSGVTVNSVTFNSATSLTANITISISADTSAGRTVTVFNQDGGVASRSNAFSCFTAGAAPVTPESVVPNHMLAASGTPQASSLAYLHPFNTSEQSFMVNGQGFSNEALVAFSRANTNASSQNSQGAMPTLTVKSSTWLSPNQIRIYINSFSDEGSVFNLVVTNPSGQRGTVNNAFSIITPESISANIQQINPSVNPVNPQETGSVNLNFKLGTAGEVVIPIFGPGGMIFKMNFNASKGFNTVAWNLRDHYGQPVPNGMYVIYVNQNGRRVAAGKIMVVNKLGR